MYILALLSNLGTMSRMCPDSLHNMTDIVTNVEFIVKLRVRACLLDLCISRVSTQLTIFSHKPRYTDQRKMTSRMELGAPSLTDVN